MISSRLISSRHKRGLGVASTAAAVALLFVALPSGAAIADPGGADEVTETVVWSDVNHRTGSISDAEALSQWTDDAFDDFGDITITSLDSGEAVNFQSDLLATRTETDGVIVLSYQADIVWADAQTSVADLTLTLSGSFARWNFTVTGGPQVKLEFSGELGADTAVRYTSAGSGVVSDDTQADIDPVLGFSVTTSGTFDGWNYTNTNDQLTATVTGSDLTFTVVYGDFTPCGFTEARTFIESITPDLARVFGTAYAPIGSCFSVPDQTVTVGSAVDLRVPFRFSDGTDPAVFAEGRGLTVDVTSLPAGLAAVVEYDAAGVPLLHITGTALEPGTITAVVSFAGLSAADFPVPPTAGPTLAAQRAVIAPGVVQPGTLAADVVITVLAAPAQPSYVPAPGDALAATGAEAKTLGSAAALLAVFGIGALLLSRRNARA